MLDREAEEVDGQTDAEGLYEYSQYLYQWYILVYIHSLRNRLLPGTAGTTIENMHSFIRVVNT
jgi:hypothetical protein